MEVDKENDGLYSNSFYCPITKRIMEDPVVLPDGESYERSVVLDILLRHSESEDRNSVDGRPSTLSENLPDVFTSSKTLLDLQRDVLSSERYEEIYKYHTERKQKNQQKTMTEEERDNRSTRDQSNDSDKEEDDTHHHDDDDGKEKEIEELLKKMCRRVLYDNRALRTIIEKEVMPVRKEEEESSPSSATNSIRREDGSVTPDGSVGADGSTTNTTTATTTTIQDDGDNELCSEYCCPITAEFMSFPVIEMEGYTYERIAIEAWLKRNHGTSPMTRNQLPPIDRLYKNNAIAELLRQEKERPPETMHPSIRRWINEKGQTLIDLESQQAEQETRSTGTVVFRLSPQSAETNERNERRGHPGLIFVALCLLATIFLLNYGNPFILFIFLIIACSHGRRYQRR